MGRPPLPIGQYGKITTKSVPGGYQALCRYRDSDGITRRVTAVGKNKTVAISNLKQTIEDRRGIGSADLTADSCISVLAEAWFKKLQETDSAEGTKDAYRDTIDRHITPGIGKLRIREATTGRLDKFLSQTAKKTTKTITSTKGVEREVSFGGPVAAKQCRTVLTSIFSMAVRYELMDVNPVRETTLPVAKKTKVRAMTPEEFNEMREDIIEWMQTPVMGPGRDQDLIDIVDALMGTGVRPGEVLALRWHEDIDLASDTPTVEISGTVKRTKKEGLHRQPFPKSESSERVLKLPPFTVTMLRARKLKSARSKFVFPNRDGELREPANFNRLWRSALGEKWDWVTPKSMRAAVATMIARELGSEVASKQLGHYNDDITKKYYIEHDSTAPDSRDVLERFRTIG